MSFELDLNTFKNKLIKESEETIKRIGEDMFVMVKDLTPIDTGKAKAGWVKTEDKYFTVINNNVEYIVYLEEGSSTQAPRGMVRVTIAKITEDIKKGKYKI